jgi:RNA polymerase sigma-32 factor
MASLADVSRLIMNKARAAPKLDAVEERGLLARIQNQRDPTALDQLAASNLRRVISIANGMRGYGLSLDDLVQEGCCGMVIAAQRFDLERGVPFAFWARLWVKAEMQEFVLRNWSIVRSAMGSDEQRMFFKLRQLKARLSADPDATSASIAAELAAAFGVSTQDVEIMQARLSQGDFSLNAPAFEADGDSGSEWGDFLVEDGDSFDDLIDDDQCAADLRAAMRELDDRERLIVEQRWLSDDVVPLEALAEWFEISRAKVRKIEIAAIEKLRQAMFAMRAAPKPEYA